MIKPQHFAALAVAAVISVALAFGLNAYYDSWALPTESGEALAPALDRNINSVATIEFKQGDKALTLVKSGTGWTVKERGGYPADAAKIASFVRHLATTQLMEPRTRVKERFDLLELEAPTSKTSKSRQVRVLDAGGQVLADVVLGKTKVEAFGSGRNGIYVRRSAEAQTWLASGEPRASFEVKDWVAPTFFNFDVANLRRITYEHPGEPPLVVEKGTEKDAKLKLVEPVPAGKKLKDTANVEGFPVAFATMDLDDVRKLTATPTGDQVSTIRLETDKGLTITMRARKDGDAIWLSYSATGEGEAKKQADEMTAKGAGWEFKLPSWKVDSILRKRADLYDAAS